MIFTSPTGPTLLLSERFYFHTLVGVPPLLSPPFPAIIVILWASFCLQHSHASCFQFYPSLSPFPHSLVSSFISLLFHLFSVFRSLSLILAPSQFTPVPSLPPSDSFFFFQCHTLISRFDVLTSFCASQRPHFSSSYPSVFCLFLQN